MANSGWLKLRAGHFRYFYIFSIINNYFFAFFNKLIWLGVDFLSRTGAEIGCQLDKKCKKTIFIIEKLANIAQLCSKTRNDDAGWRCSTWCQFPRSSTESSSPGTATSSSTPTTTARRCAWPSRHSARDPRVTLASRAIFSNRENLAEPFCCCCSNSKAIFV